MESCPTKAIVAPHVLDASKCITYLTLETKNEIPAELAQSLCNRLTGCDICQLVCPWNSKATENKTPEFQPQSDLITMKAADWQSLDKPTFDRIFKDSTIERLGHARLKNTIRLLSGTK